ncbi:high mobility group box domain-containing protein, partial [Gautieria morchelliformis]
MSFYPDCTAPAPAPPKGKYHGPGRAPGHVPRPPNAFILFRSHFCANDVIPQHQGVTQQMRSRVAAKLWGRMSPEDKKPWHDEARKVKQEHKIRYPNFQYRP